jgi:LmbE family N-acetylglucosaminyl deacetylase
MVTAHPDDEDGGMLAYESRGQGARVELLTLNRGESGANVMSSDFFDALGLVRTEELLAADRYYGVKQYFTRVVNYGFSKTKEESYQNWSHDRVLYDAVRVIRMTRPLVITSVFIGGPSDGHGNHQVAGETAQEVFRAAADPNVFPDQIQAGLRPWKALKMYARIPRARVKEKGVYDYATHHWAPARVFDYIHQQWLPWDLSADVVVPEGELDPLVGLSYLQIARQGLGFQKSQNGGTGMPPAGEMKAAYHRFGSAILVSGSESSFFDGIDVSLEGIASLASDTHPVFLSDGLKKMNGFVEEAANDFRPAEPAQIAPALVAGLKQTDQLIMQVKGSQMTASEKYDVLHELRIKREQFNTALLRALNITLEAEAAGGSRTVIPGQKFGVTVHLNNASAQPVQLEWLTLVAQTDKNWPIRLETALPSTLAGNKPVIASFRVTVPENAGITKPYFTRANVEQGWYEIHDARYLNQPFAPYPLAGWAELSYDGALIRIGQVVQTVRHVSGEGVVAEPLVVAPAISITMSPAGIVPLNAQSFTISAGIRSEVKGAASGTVRLELPSGWRSKPTSSNFQTAKDGDEQQIDFRVFPSQAREQEYTLTAIATFDGREYREGFRVTGYPGLRPYYLYRPSTYKAAGVDVAVAPNLNIGYVMGSGDEVPQSLAILGVHPKLLTSADLASGDLSRYDAILLGIRAHAVRDDLKANNARLLEYVKNGGVVIVQYNTPEFDHDFGPYPYKMTNDPEEVTDEASRVVILEPNNPVFSWPNRISEKDFRGWVAERGSKFMSSWDARYEPLLETHDPGQDPQKGGLLYARYGKGVYIYNAYAFYRQLPEGVTGAYRIFGNLISLPKNPQK